MPRINLDPALKKAAEDAYEVVSAGNIEQLSSIKTAFEGTAWRTGTYLTLEFIKWSAGKLVERLAGTAAPSGVGVLILGLYDIGENLWTLNDRITQFVLLWNATKTLNTLLVASNLEPARYSLDTSSFRLAHNINNSMRLIMHRSVKAAIIDDIGNDPIFSGRRIWQTRSWWRDLRDYLEAEVVRLERRELANHLFFLRLPGRIDSDRGAIRTGSRRQRRFSARPRLRWHARHI